MSDCIIWQGPVGNHGYGRKYIGGGRRDLAHRCAYREHVGPIPDEHIIHHGCGTRLCVNPDHLILTTQSVHASQLDAHSPIKKFCVHGHEIAVTGRTARGACKVCQRAASARNYYVGRRAELVSM